MATKRQISTMQRRRVVLRRSTVMSVCAVAAVCVAALGFAPQARAQTQPQTQPSSSRLQPLVNEAVAQLQLSYRHDRAERQQRYEEIGQAIATWNKSARGPAENEQLAEWLRAVMRASMPGSKERLPPQPVFETTARTPAVPQLDNEMTKSASPGPVDNSKQESVRNETTAESLDGAAHGEHISETRPVDDTRSATQSAADPNNGDPFRDDPIPADK